MEGELCVDDDDDDDDDESVESEGCELACEVSV